MRCRLTVGTDPCFELLECPECVYLTEKGKCALRHGACRGKSCAAAFSTEKFRRWQKRLQALTDKEQIRIAEKYYRGRTPWRDGDT